MVKLYDRYTEILADDEQKYLNWSRLVSVREDIDQILDILQRWHPLLSRTTKIIT